MKSLLRIGRSASEAARVPGPRRRSQTGISATEFLIAAPLLLFLGLSLWQWALIIQARQIVESAVREAVRGGAVGHAEVSAIEEGLLLGLAPLWVETAQLGDRMIALRASRVAFDAAARAGWVDWRQLTPTRESFEDWAVSLRSESGVSGAERVIPSDNATWRMRHAQPAGGALGDALGDTSGERIGRASGQSFREAGILRLELTVGVPLQVPLAGAVIGRMARWAAGCPGAAACQFYSGVDHRGVSFSRIPLRVTADARMQSDARMTSRTPTRAGAGPSATRREALLASPGEAGPGNDQSWHWGPMQGLADSPGDVAHDLPEHHSARQPGFLGIGAEREVWAPGSCGITPS